MVNQQKVLRYRIRFFGQLFLARHADHFDGHAPKRGLAIGHNRAGGRRKPNNNRVRSGRFEQPLRQVFG